MSDFSAIRAVTETLDALLTQRLGIAVDRNTPPFQISATTPLVSLFLYRVQFNPSLMNLPWQQGPGTQLTAPPFGLNLHYLITPYGSDLTQIQQTLGEVMLALHDDCVIRPGHPALAPQLATMTEELRIVPHHLPLADMLDLWKAFGSNVAFRLSVAYEVSAIVIDSLASRNVQLVQERALAVGTLR